MSNNSLYVPNLFRLVNGLRYFGAGAKVKRNIFNFDDTYWILTRVELSKDQAHGKAFGKLVWRGRLQPVERKINSANKHQWSLVALPNYAKFVGKMDQIDQMVPKEK